MKSKRHIVLIIAFISIGIFSCGEDKSYVPAKVPDNPYDTIDYGGEPPMDSIDAASFLGLHTYIFSTTCAVPGCHDGSFEPDFRTVQSAYNTLVYHKVEKNNAAGDFEYRVVPGKPLESWLNERITTNDAVLGRMPLYDTLSQTEIDLITNWIKDGAKDAYGNSPILPTYLPSFFGLLAFENDTMGMRIDTPRVSILEPLVFPNNTTVDLWVGLLDIDNDGGFLPASDFTYNKYKISNHLYEFSTKPELSLIVEPALKPYWGINPFGQGKVPYYHHFKINTGDYPNGQVQYFRLYVKDKDHNDPTEIPSDGSPVYLLTNFSFVVK